MQILTAALLILIGVLFFGFIIFFHELGHFLLAKASGIRVNEFALGMGLSSLAFEKGRPSTACACCPLAATAPWRGRLSQSRMSALLATSRCGNAF